MRDCPQDKAPSSSHGPVSRSGIRRGAHGMTPRNGSPHALSLPLTDTDREDMLARIGVSDVDALFSDVPAGKLLKAPVDLPRAKGELEVERILGKMAGKNTAGGAVLRRRRCL
jgi:hypothetical protein